MFMNVLLPCELMGVTFVQKKTAQLACSANCAVHVMDYVMTFRIGFVFLGFHLLLGHHHHHQSLRQSVGP